MAQYHQIIVETYHAVKSGKSTNVHVRPIEGQVFPTTYDVECSRAMREAHPIGTRFRIRVKQIDREGTPFLYSYHGWPYEVVN